MGCRRDVKDMDIRQGLPAAMVLLPYNCQRSDRCQLLCGLKTDQSAPASGMRVRTLTGGKQHPRM